MAFHPASLRRKASVDFPGDLACASTVWPFVREEKWRTRSDLLPRSFAILFVSPTDGGVTFCISCIGKGEGGRRKQCSYKRGSISLSPSIPTAWPIRCRSTNCYFSCLVRHTNPLLQASFTIPLTLPETKSKQYPSSSGSAAGWL